MFHLRTLGPPALERDGIVLDHVGAQRKTLALLALLAVARHRGISRERLTAFLWPESPSDRARGALKQALHVVRRQLGSPEAVQGTSELRFNPAFIASDVCAFLQALEDGELEVAADLYGGPFLDGFHLPGAPEFEEWLSLQRADLARKYGSALAELASAAQDRGDHRGTIEWLRRLHAADPLSAPVTLRLMHALETVGERAAALRCAQMHSALYRDELGMPPDPHVAALAERWRGEDAARAATFGDLPLSQPSFSTRSDDAGSAIASNDAAGAPLPWAQSRTMRRSYRLAASFTLIAIAVAVALFQANNSGAGSGDPAGAVDRSNAVLSFANVNADSAAYELYLRGRHSWRQRSREGLEHAVVFFEGAIEREPTFAMAYVGLADAYVNLSNFGYRLSSDALARAAVAADRAVALAPQLAEAHASRGFVLASTQRFSASEAAFRQAIALNPGYVWAHHYYSLLLLTLGRTEEAVDHNRRALAADPLSLPSNATRGIILLQRGEDSHAERELQRALNLSSTFHLTQYYLAVARAARGEYDGATRLLEQTANQAPQFTGVPGARALVFRHTGRAALADSLIADLEVEARTDERARINLAFAYAVLGQLDAAFAMFEQVTWDVPSLVELRANPLLRALRADPRYPALLQQIGVGR